MIYHILGTVRDACRKDTNTTHPGVEGKFSRGGQQLECSETIYGTIT